MKKYSALTIVVLSCIAFLSLLPTIFNLAYADDLINKCNQRSFGKSPGGWFGLEGDGYYQCRCNGNQIECPRPNDMEVLPPFNCDYKIVEKGDKVDGKSPDKYICGANTICQDSPAKDEEIKSRVDPVCKPDPAKVKGCKCANPNSVRNNQNGFWCDAENRSTAPTHWCSTHEICSDADTSNAPDRKCAPLYCACRQESGKGTKMACKRADDGKPFPAENSDPNIKETECSKDTICIGRDITGGSARCGTENDLKQTEDVSKAKKSGITCTCKNPSTFGDGKNGMDCTKNGVAFGYTLFCRDANQACINGDGKTWPMSHTTPDSSLPEDATKLKIHHNIDKDGADWTKQDALNVACEDKAKIDEGKEPPPLPVVQPPPCAPGQLVKGVCKSFLTAFGTIDTNASSFLLKIFAIALAIAGGLAILLIMRAGYIIMTSAGNGEQVKKGREQLVAAIVGLLFIIFSFVILEVIGIDILRLRDFMGAGQIPPLGTCSPGKDTCTNGYVCNYNNGTGQCVKAATGATCDPNNGNNQCPTGQRCIYNGSTGQCQ